MVVHVYTPSAREVETDPGTNWPTSLSSEGKRRWDDTEETTLGMVLWPSSTCTHLFSHMYTSRIASSTHVTNDKTSFYDILHILQLKKLRLGSTWSGSHCNLKKSPLKFQQVRHWDSVSDAVDCHKFQASLGYSLNYTVRPCLKGSGRRLSS